MKLLIDTKARRVLFAEASKDVVDFLFSLLALPGATAVKLVGTDAMVGSVGNLYASVAKLDATYVQPGAAKDAFLCPTVLSPAASSANTSLPVCRRRRRRLSLVRRQHVGASSGATTSTTPAATATWRTRSARAARPVPDPWGRRCSGLGSGGGGSGKKAKKKQATAAGGVVARGLVQGVVTYTVMDNLTVSPMSAIFSITLLNTFGVRDLGDLQEKTVQLGYNEQEAVDFLFSLLALPVGTVAMLLGPDAMAGSVGELYRSVESLERSFTQPGADMDALLRPLVPPPAAAAAGPLLPDAATARPTTRCPSCGGRPPAASSGGVQVQLGPGRMILTPSAPAGGFVRGNMTYMVRDDLAVAPMSTISSISVFNALAVREIGAVEERTVQLGYTEALKILKASFESKTVLTDVFLRG
ncbi:unnamed protein product [Urochloa decumbens]|uniref:DUF674 family protein n=1 Tax=Urochloa decumbens TaxID=240449 RepID=A0ABC8ZD52_9POAL